ncbi:CaiB/BaiF CoA transferase family protein [Halosegnis marinus]|uniref:CaiB/BaiF CoA transferase family protein n=1 Tax=Halosegnis marinus TaxID=3034023 RepID=A0ABD5ZSC9_9EURY|nr:CaiB/BaiF CoA-transferase family protein [Halosegnis sp. DT85]
MDLSGVRVLDLTRLLPGPYATQLLADCGADVVKVEDTGAGDYARGMPPTTDAGHGELFDAVNRGKRSVALDLKTEGGTEAFRALAAGADAVIESFRPGVVDRLGVGYGDLRGANSGLVYCSLSGYGQDGPLADRVGHDLNYVGLAGLLDMTRETPDEAPRVPGYPVADMAGGLFAAFAVCGALLSRELGDGTGEHLDVSMTDAVLSFGQAVAPAALRGENPRPGATPLTGAYPWYDVYEAAEGYVTLAALEPQFWEAFCGTVGREEWVPVHGTEDPAERTALREELASLFAERTRDEWVDLLGDTDAAVGGVYSPGEAVEHPQVAARGLVDREGEEARVGSPVRGTEAGDESLPAQGEHTVELLEEAGYGDEELAALRESGAVDYP